jgi:hypothetical protein
MHNHRQNRMSGVHGGYTASLNSSSMASDCDSNSHQCWIPRRQQLISIPRVRGLWGRAGRRGRRAIEMAGLDVFSALPEKATVSIRCPCGPEPSVYRSSTKAILESVMGRIFVRLYRCVNCDSPWDERSAGVRGCQRCSHGDVLRRMDEKKTLRKRDVGMDRSTDHKAWVTETRTL